jgi:hypothetical protein
MTDRMTGPDDDALPELIIADVDGTVLDLLRDIQRAALTHSEAAQAMGAALVEEGRLFAQTAEGRRWRETILGSALLERALLVWQNATLWMAEEPDGAPAPSSLVDAVAAVAASPRRDALLDRLFRDLDEGAGRDL